MYTVIGLEKVDYVNKANKRVQGTKVHSTYQNDKTFGLCAESFYMNLDIDTFQDRFNLNIGDVILPLYNRYGNVQAIDIVKKGE